MASMNRRRLVLAVLAAAVVLVILRRVPGPPEDEECAELVVVPDEPDDDEAAEVADLLAFLEKDLAEGMKMPLDPDGLLIGTDVAARAAYVAQVHARQGAPD